MLLLFRLEKCQNNEQRQKTEERKTKQKKQKNLKDKAILRSFFIYVTRIIKNNVFILDSV
jgi:hypothetical protein